MDVFVLLCGFVGAWLLVAGPIYQAALELRDQDFRREQVAAVSARVPQPAGVSPWWWLLPPVHYLLARRRGRAYREAVLAELTPAEVEGLVAFTEKATAWMLVGLGGSLLAAKETWELCEHFELGPAIYWPLVVVIGLICSANTAVRMRRSADIRAKRGVGASAPAAP